MEVPIPQHQHSSCRHALDPKAHKDNKEPSRTIGDLSLSTGAKEMNPTELSPSTSQEETLRPSKPSDSYDRVLQLQSTRSFGDAIDASRGMIAMSQNTTPHGIYSSQRGSVASYGFPATHSTTSSISSNSNYWSYFGSSINSSVSDYSNIDSDIESVSSHTLPRSLGLPNRGIPLEQQSMFGKPSPKVTSSTAKKYKCKVCDKGFTRTSYLQTHMYSHTGEKPFSCEVEGCGRHFSVVSNLRRHRKTHKGDVSDDVEDDNTDIYRQPPNTFTHHKDSISVTKEGSQSSHMPGTSLSLTREQSGMRRAFGMVMPYEDEGDMVSGEPFGNLLDTVNKASDMSYLKSNSCTTSPQSNTFPSPWVEELKTTLFPTSLSPNPAGKSQDSRSLAGQSLSSNSNEIPSVILKASTTTPTPTVDNMVKPSKIGLTPNLGSEGFLSGFSIDYIPKLDATDKNGSSMNLPKQGSEEAERDGILENKKLLMPMEEPSEDFNVVNAEADGTTPEPYSGDSDNTSGSSIYQQLCDAAEKDAEDHQEVVASTLDPMRQALVDRLMDEFWIIFSQSWDTGHRECAGASTSSSSVTNRISNFTSESSSTLGSRKRPREDDELPNDKSGRNSRGSGDAVRPSSRPEESTRFACPFRKHSTRLYSIYSHPICALSHWETIARVKEHLYRGHRMAVHCKRCWKLFNNQEQLDSHLTVATSDICDLRPGHPPEGITSEHERCLRSRKKTSPNQSEADRWKDIYKLLFPDEEIPSPYFDPPQEEASMSPDSRDLASYENYIRRELPRLVRSHIEGAVRREMQPLEASLISSLVEIIQDCQDRVFRSYRETQSRSSELQMPPMADDEAPVSSILLDNRGWIKLEAARPRLPSTI